MSIGTIIGGLFLLLLICIGDSVGGQGKGNRKIYDPDHLLVVRRRNGDWYVWDTDSQGEVYECQTRTEAENFVREHTE